MIFYIETRYRRGKWRGCWASSNQNDALCLAAFGAAMICQFPHMHNEPIRTLGIRVRCGRRVVAQWRNGKQLRKAN